MVLFLMDIMDTMTVTYNLPGDQASLGHTNGYQHRPNSIEIQHTNGGWAGPQGAATRGPSVRFADEEPLSSRYTSEPIYTPRILREPGSEHGAAPGPRQHVSEASARDSNVVVVGPSSEVSS